MAQFHFLMNSTNIHICYGFFIPNTTVQEVKYYLKHMWPRVIPKNVKKIILTYDGNILEDELTLYRSGLFFGGFIPCGAITIHVTVQPPPRSHVRAIMARPRVMAQPRDKALFQFLLNDRMHICYGLFLPTATVQELKQYLMENWRRDEYLIPKNVKEIILTFDGKLLKDERTLYRSRLLSDDIIPCGAITINVTGQPLPPSIAVTVQPPPPSNVRYESVESFAARVCRFPCKIL